jgi:predicted transcriptional regulator
MSEQSKFIAELYKCKVKDLMEAIGNDIPVVEKKVDIGRVFSFLAKTHHVWVVDGKDTCRVVGVITDYDTLSLFSPPYTPLQFSDKPNIHSFQYGLTITAEEIMSKNPITTFAEESIKDVLTKMTQHKVKQLPVIDKNEKLLGEINLLHFIEKFNNEQLKIVKS